MTIANAIEACRLRLRSVSDVPWLEARMLASYVTGLDASAIVAYGDNAISRDRREQLFALVERRAAGEPVAYLTGAKQFCGLTIAVDRRALVPRPETEGLVAAVRDDWRGRRAQILELGTGSGAIACALAVSMPDARILATEISAEAFELAQANVERLQLGERVTLSLGDLFAAVVPLREFDVIVANLPYVGDDHADALEEPVRRNEPRIALWAGADGLAVYRRMLPATARYLRAGGSIYLECAPFNAIALAAIAEEAFPDTAPSIDCDAAGRQRIVVIRTAKTNP